MARQMVGRQMVGVAVMGLLGVLPGAAWRAGAQVTAPTAPVAAAPVRAVPAAGPVAAGPVAASPVAPAERRQLPTGTEGAAARGAAGTQGEPAAPTAAATVAFPAPDPRNFTASSPSVATVNSFLHALWGFDENRTWSVAAIEPTQAPGVVVVHVLVAEKTQPSRMAQTTMFITPDGQHAIAGEVIRFGAQPFAETRALLAKRADGPSRGAADKQLELVEFTDLECAACRTAQATMDQLQQQFPQAHVVVEDMPLTRLHPFAYQAATVGYCVRQAKGDAGYFAYAGSVMAAVADLTRDKVDATLGAAAKAAGADPAAMMICAATPAAKAAVDAVVQLGTEAGVTDVPTLVVNGRGLPLAQVPLQALGRIVVFQGQLDGFVVQPRPTLSTLK